MDKNRKCISEELSIELKAKRTPFKAGADLAKKFQLVSIEVNDESNDDTHLLELKLVLNTDHCTSKELNSK